MLTREEALNKIAAYDNKIKNGDYEGALALLDSIPSNILKNYHEAKLNIIKKIFSELINNKKFDEAIRKIDDFKRKYDCFSIDLIKIESKIYYYLAIKENKEEKVDSALRHSEKSLSLDRNNEDFKFLIIEILIYGKQSYDKALEKIRDLETNISKEKKNYLKNLKAAALNNKANDLNLTDLEGALNLANKAIEIEPSENLDIIKKNRLDKFKKLFAQKITDHKFEEIPKLFEKGNKFKFKSKEMENYLDINKHLSKCFEYKYLVKYAKKETYENIILNTLEYIRKGISEDNFELKYEFLKLIF